MCSSITGTPGQKWVKYHPFVIQFTVMSHWKEIRTIQPSIELNLIWEKNNCHQEIESFFCETMCATIIGTHNCNALYNFPVTIKCLMSLRTFFFTESLQIIERPRSSIYLCTLLFSSAHIFSMGFRSGNWDGHGRRLFLCSVNHFCIDLDVLKIIVIGRQIHWHNIDS